MARFTFAATHSIQQSLVAQCVPVDTAEDDYRLRCTLLQHIRPVCMTRVVVSIILLLAGPVACWMQVFTHCVFRPVRKVYSRTLVSNALQIVHDPLSAAYASLVQSCCPRGITCTANHSIFQRFAEHRTCCAGRGRRS